MTTHELCVAVLVWILTGLLMGAALLALEERLSRARRRGRAISLLRTWRNGDDDCHITLDTATQEQLRAALLAGARVLSEDGSAGQVCVIDCAGTGGVPCSATCAVPDFAHITSEGCLYCWLDVLLNTPVPGGERG